MDDNTSGQDLRRRGQFAVATERLRRCAASSCPAIVRADCMRRLSELEAAQPSLVFEVRDSNGADVMAVQVYVDGTLVADRLDGRPLKIDPGPHKFSFEVGGQPTAVTQEILVREGEPARHERLVLPRSVSQPAASTPPAGPPPVVPTSEFGTRRVLGLSLAGLGVTGLAIGTVFGLEAKSAWKNVKDTCGGDPLRCTNAPAAYSQQSKARQQASISTAAFIAGGASAALGALIYFAHLESQDRRNAAFALTPNIGSEKVGVFVEGSF